MNGLTHAHLEGKESQPPIRRNCKNNLQESRSAAAQFRQKPLLGKAQSPFSFNVLEILHGRRPITEPDHQDNEEGSLARAASLIGQLGDPHYLRKANALFYEFEEIGVNKQLGYASPADLTDLYPKFYFNSISPHLQTAIRYLNVTSSGRQWIAGLHSNVFRAERELNLARSD